MLLLQFSIIFRVLIAQSEFLYNYVVLFFVFSFCIEGAFTLEYHSEGISG